MKTLLQNKTFQWVVIFSIAMGFLESAVVIYARALWFPDGFNFPMTIPMEPYLAICELCREFATIIMLLAIGYIAGKSRSERFAYFILSFGVWDILYYIFLKLFLNWPATLMDWDILFLLPTTWFGPVITPVIIAVQLIVLGGFMIHFNRSLPDPRINSKERWIMVSGATILIISFTWEFSIYLFNHLPAHSSFDTMMLTSQQFVPKIFPWWMYWTGQVVMSFGALLYVKRNLVVLKKPQFS